MENSVLTFNQWINVEYGIVGKEYKKLPEGKKQRIKEEYDKYVKCVSKED